MGFWKFFYWSLTTFIALVWVINGLYCKVLDMVPRHGRIVGEILGEAYSKELTVLIGVSEVFMGLWVLSTFKSKWNALTQIFIVLLMNIIEIVLVPDLLLWGRLNMLFAVLFSLVIYFNEFVLARKLKSENHES